MLEVLVAQYPLSDVWALPGVRAGGSQLVQKGLGSWGPVGGWIPCRKGRNTDGGLSEEVPLPPPQSICMWGCCYQECWASGGPVTYAHPP